jgi:hypothetical protein
LYFVLLLSDWVVLVCGRSGVRVVVVVDSLVSCAMTGSDIASATSDPTTTAHSFLDFIRILLMVSGTLTLSRTRVPAAANCFS